MPSTWFELYRTIVMPTHCDLYGHMSVRRYAAFFDDAGWQILAQAGVSLTDLRSGGLCDGRTPRESLGEGLITALLLTSDPVYRDYRPGKLGRRASGDPGWGDRRIPDDNLRAEARDTRMPWTAYVLPGTLRGKQLATKYQCATCHGANLEGIGPVPALAGRSPSYTMRQLFDMKTGARRGPWAELMKPIVTSMSVQDMAAVSAFAASTPAPVAPRPSTTTAAR